MPSAVVAAGPSGRLFQSGHPIPAARFAREYPPKHVGAKNLVPRFGAARVLKVIGQYGQAVQPAELLVRRLGGEEGTEPLPTRLLNGKVYAALEAPRRCTSGSRFDR